MKSYYERTDVGLKRLITRQRRNADAYDASLFGLFMPVPYWEDDVAFFEGILQSRKEGKKPPFDLGQQVEVIVGRARPVDFERGPTLKKGARYFVKRAVYVGRNRWKVQLHDVVPGGSTYYSAQSFRLVPN